MICYKDKTFCPFWENCKDSSTCCLALTPEVIEAAESWGDSGIPIATYSSEPKCFKEKG